MIPFLARTVLITSMMTVVGCALEAPQKYPLHFDPELLMQQEFSAKGSQKTETVILPDDLISRPEVTEIISQFIALKKSESMVAAVTFIENEMDHHGNALAPKDLSDLQLVIATALFGRAKFPEAENACDQAIKLDPSNWRAYHFRAMLREKKEDDRGFREDIRRANELRKGKSVRSFSTKGGII